MINEEQDLSPAQRREQIDSLIAQCAQSGLSKKEFCLQNNIKYMTFIGWVARRSGKKKKQKVAAPAFVPLKIVQPSSNIFAEVHLENSRRIIFYQSVSVEYLRHFIK